VTTPGLINLDFHQDVHLGFLTLGDGTGGGVGMYIISLVYASNLSLEQVALHT